MSIYIVQGFPDFNIYSTPLLLLVVQGFIFVCLLFYRYYKKRITSDLFLGIILLVVCYQQICYTVGFMGWYDTFRNTKINYWLIPVSLAIAPLLYFYVKAVTTSHFIFKGRDWWHFMPIIMLVIYRMCIYTYDALQPSFEDTQNGYLKIHLDEPIVLPALSFISFIQMLLYLAFTFQLFYFYRKKINAFFSDTYILELRWILSFLIAFSLLFIYGTAQTIIGSFFTELHYTERYWLNITMALVVLFVGIKGYFTDTTNLQKLAFRFTPDAIVAREQPDLNRSTVSKDEVKRLDTYMIAHRPYLEADLNLITLSRKLNLTRAQLSHLINEGHGKNFNDYVNGYRISAVKQMLKDGKQEQLSLLGIALECGFNSKATFNRVFKKIAGTSPSAFLQKIE